MLQSLLHSGKYSDLTISCEGKRFQVHRAIVCSQSSFFDAVLKGGFKEVSLSEVDLPDDDLVTIQRVISFLYNQDYQDINESQVQSRNCALDHDIEPYIAIWNNLRVFIAADKFDISPLKDLTRSRIIEWIDKNASKSPLIIEKIWTTIPPYETLLRDAITKSISSDADRFLTYNESIEVMQNLPDITISILKELVAVNYSMKVQIDLSKKKLLPRR
ncbi:uncharacterized protein N7479_006306 [Penicillium vulpinum]|uniref:uncharacterized protein n=1 Tax=Penicillium vulpinum TaxID=29845 RepID=UPI0025468082|nr:uncharacterized protein N7479_006306 [Penicillium vulpinum]KAJ5959156.1 hypothetical protein N7479_006306 [Penicillium vulpinum]